MPKETSFGAIVFRREEGRIYYLLLRHGKKYYNFPKGHAEKNETPTIAAKREIFEETGIKEIRFLKGFKEINSYFFKHQGKTIFKNVFFFLAETKENEVLISKEHIGYEWLAYEEALERLNFKSLKNILRKANSFLAQNI